MTLPNPIILDWFRRTCGTWTSDQRYLLASEMRCINPNTEFTVAEGAQSNQFITEWTGQTSGTMELELNGDILSGSHDYFCEGATTEVGIIDEDTIVFHTTCGGMKIREEIRLILDDTVRLRQVVGTCEESDQVLLTGHYTERRI